MLAFQRYGRGKALALPIQDSWLWRMNAKMPVDRHDPRDVLAAARSAGWSTTCPTRSMLTMTQDRVDPGEPMKLTAEVVDAAVRRRQRRARRRAGHVAVRARRPKCRSNGRSSRTASTASSVVPDEEGLYAIRVAAIARLRRTSDRTRAYVRASAADSEYFDATMRAPLLKRIAEETGGRFYTPANAATLPEAISYSGRGVTVVEERDLWDMPAILLLLIALIGARVGLPPRAGPDMSRMSSRTSAAACRGDVGLALEPQARSPGC